MEIYAGNLSWSAEDQDLHDAFAQFGEVTSAKIVKDRDSGRSRGFGFVTMPNAEEAQEAISSLNDQDFMGRNMNCREATPRQEKPRGGGGGFNRGGGGFKGGGGGRGRGGDRGGFNRDRDRGGYDRDRRY
ncbi:MAG: RNA-binding protein [Verrucomicrobiae bacterium]|nr:RNA-binding protein [Verrucomicrobiae bacterium]